MGDLTPAELELRDLLTRGVFDSPGERARHILEVLTSTDTAASRQIKADPTGPPTLDELRDELEEVLEDGAHCPVCGQYAKRYRRQVNSAQARKLIGAYRRFGDEWFDMPLLVRELGIPGRDESALHYFDLIESSFGRREDGGRDGVWRITGKGKAYIEREGKIPRYALVYNGAVQGFDGPERTIDDALGTAFDWSVLMGFKADTA